MRALVTGANGFIGRSLLGALVAGGEKPVGLVREPTSGPCDLRVVSAWNETELTRAFRGCDVVFHAASVVHRRAAPLDEYVRFNVDGTRALGVAARSAGVSRIVFFSSIKVYGEEPVGLIDESTAPSGEPGYAATKLEAERVLERLAAEGGPALTILRLAPVYGRGDKGNVRTMADRIARKRFFLPGDGGTRKSLVHVSTVSSVAAAAATSEKNGVFVVADSRAPTMRELADAIARGLGVPPPRSVPVPFLALAARVLDAGARLARRSPPGLHDLVRKSRIPTVCSPARVERELGVRCHVDLDETIRDEIAWLREQGVIRPLQPRA